MTACDKTVDKVYCRWRASLYRSISTHTNDERHSRVEYEAKRHVFNSCKKLQHINNNRCQQKASEDCNLNVSIKSSQAASLSRQIFASLAQLYHIGQLWHAQWRI